MSLAEATAGAAERIRRADVEGGLAFFVDVVVGPGGWRTPARPPDGTGDNAHALLGQSGEQCAPFSRSDMEAIRAPTLLLGSGGCAPPFARALDAMERWLPDATRVTIPGTTHEMSQQDPEAFNRAVRGFLAGRG